MGKKKKNLDQKNKKNKCKSSSIISKDTVGFVQNQNAFILHGIKYLKWSRLCEWSSSREFLVSVWCFYYFGHPIHISETRRIDLRLYCTKCTLLRKKTTYHFISLIQCCKKYPSKDVRWKKYFGHSQRKTITPWVKVFICYLLYFWYKISFWELKIFVYPRNQFQHC